MYKHPKHNPNKVVRRRIPWLEVFPETETVYHDTPGQLDEQGTEETRYYARLRSSNGGKLMTTEAYDTHSNAIRAAKAINTSACLGRLQIRDLAADGSVHRIIEPKVKE